MTARVVSVLAFAALTVARGRLRLRLVLVGDHRAGGAHLSPNGLRPNDGHQGREADADLVHDRPARRQTADSLPAWQRPAQRCRLGDRPERRQPPPLRGHRHSRRGQDHAASRLPGPRALPHGDRRLPATERTDLAKQLAALRDGDRRGTGASRTVAATDTKRDGGRLPLHAHRPISATSDPASVSHFHCH